MTTTRRIHVSFVLATYNRREIVEATLSRILDCGLNRGEFEIIAVDNASHDGTPDAIAGRCDVLIRLDRNAGSCAKADGITHASGEYIIFLDDDSFPRNGSVTRMIELFEQDPQLGAAGFTVHLPDGRMEGGALPDVFVGCGVGFRAEALRRVGGLDRSFFMQAEEYDLAFRLLNSGWRVQVFDDLHVDHLKTQQTRKNQRTTFLDIRNNLRLSARYLPASFYRMYRDEWLLRYAWLALRDGHMGPFVRGVSAGFWFGRWERRLFARHRLRAVALEHFFRWEFLQRRMSELAAAGVSKSILADLGKNVLAYDQAAKAAGVEILAIGDDRFCAPNRYYRGIPVLSLDEALRLRCDATVIGNMSAVHGTYTNARLITLGCQPVYHWFGSRVRTTDNQDGLAISAPRAAEQPTAHAFAHVS